MHNSLGNFENTLFHDLLVPFSLIFCKQKTYFELKKATNKNVQVSLLGKIMPGLNIKVG